MDKIQLNVKDISQAEFDAFLPLLHGQYSPRNVKPTEDGHFVVYQYGEGKTKFNVCYDKVAHSVQATAQEEVLQLIKSCLYRCKSAPPIVTKPIASMPDSAPTQVAQNPAQQSVKPSNDKAAKRLAAIAEKERKKAEQSAQKERKKKKQTFPANILETAAAPVAEPLSAAVQPSYKDGYSLSKYELSKLEDGISALKEHPAVHEIKREESQVATTQHFIKFTIVGKSKAKAIIQYAIKRQVVQIQGKPSDLTDLVQNVLSGKSSETEILQARVDYNKAREDVKKPVSVKPASDVNVSSVKKALTKSMPHGVMFLSKQSQTYLYFALIDLESNLSNYGGILATAYQGLENLIANLQQAQSIKVKMIGQAYEKLEGKYTLKAAYRRKIKSIVYNEVMSALYTEYFEKRHYYTHSDNFSDEARVLNDQTAAKAELTRLMTIIEYNCAKLTEINFRMDNAVGV